MTSANLPPESQGVLLGPLAVSQLAANLAAQAGGNAAQGTPKGRHRRADPVRVRVGQVVETEFRYQHEIELGKLTFDDDSPTDDAPTFESYDRDDPVVACGLEKWLLREEEWVQLRLMNGLWFITEHRRLFIFQFREASQCPDPTSSHIIDPVDDEVLTTPQNVEDPLCIMDDLRAGDKGLCYLQDSKFWAVTAPCP